jgi:D-alanyl-D-alanine carboxypeptidase
MRPTWRWPSKRLAAAAQHDGGSLIIVSAFRSNAEQAKLFAAHSDPKWVVPPGKSLHRLGTELDLGPSSAYGWLAANAPRFGFIKRYSWEPWPYGHGRNRCHRLLRSYVAALDGLLTNGDSRFADLFRWIDPLAAGKLAEEVRIGVERESGRVAEFGGEFDGRVAGLDHEAGERMAKVVRADGPAVDRDHGGIEAAPAPVPVRGVCPGAAAGARNDEDGIARVA